MYLKPVEKLSVLHLILGLINKNRPIFIPSKAYWNKDRTYSLHYSAAMYLLFYLFHFLYGIITLHENQSSYLSRNIIKNYPVLTSLEPKEVSTGSIQHLIDRRIHQYFLNPSQNI